MWDRQIMYEWDIKLGICAWYRFDYCVVLSHKYRHSQWFKKRHKGEQAPKTSSNVFFGNTLIKNNGQIA